MDGLKCFNDHFRHRCRARPQSVLPEFERRRVERLLSQFYDRRVLAQFGTPIHLGHIIRGNSVTLLEFSPRFDNLSVWIESPVAQFRLNGSTGAWSLYWRNRDRKWRRYKNCVPARNLGRLLAEVDRDTTHIFWG
jgi:hypothetical protein